MNTEYSLNLLIIIPIIEVIFIIYTFIEVIFIIYTFLLKQGFTKGKKIYVNKEKNTNYSFSFLVFIIIVFFVYIISVFIKREYILSSSFTVTKSLMYILFLIAWIHSYRKYSIFTENGIIITPKFYSWKKIKAYSMEGNILKILVYTEHTEKISNEIKIIVPLKDITHISNIFKDFNIPGL